MTIVSAFCANVMVVGETSLLSVTATSLALRGPDGSMMTATDGLYEERRNVFRTFGYGLAATVGSVLICVWLMLSNEAALVCMSLTIMTCFKMYTSYLRISHKFEYNEKDTVDFRDIFDGPGAIGAIGAIGALPSGNRNRNKKIRPVNANSHHIDHMYEYNNDSEEDQVSERSEELEDIALVNKNSITNRKRTMKNEKTNMKRVISRNKNLDSSHESISGDYDSQDSHSSDGKRTRQKFFLTV